MIVFMLLNSIWSMFTFIVGLAFGKTIRSNKNLNLECRNDGIFLTNNQVAQIKNLLSPVTNLAEMQLDNSFNEKEDIMDGEAIIVKGAVREIVKIIKCNRSTF